MKGKLWSFLTASNFGFAALGIYTGHAFNAAVAGASFGITISVFVEKQFEPTKILEEDENE